MGRCVVIGWMVSLSSKSYAKSSVSSLMGRSRVSVIGVSECWTLRLHLPYTSVARVVFLITHFHNVILYFYVRLQHSNLFWNDNHVDAQVKYKCGKHCYCTCFLWNKVPWLTTISTSLLSLISHHGDGSVDMKVWNIGHTITGVSGLMQVVALIDVSSAVQSFLSAANDSCLFL